MIYKKINSFKAHTDRVSSLTFYKDSIIISGSWDGTIKLWGIKDGKLEKKFGTDDRVYENIRITPRNHFLLAIADNSTIEIWNLESGEKINVFESNSSDSDKWLMTDDEKFLILKYEENFQDIWKIWDIKTGKLIKNLDFTPFAVIPGSDNKNLVIGFKFNREAPTEERRISGIWDLATEDLILKFESIIFPGSFRCITPDNKYIISGQYHQGFSISDIENGTEISKLERSPRHIPKMTDITPNSKFLILPNRGVANEQLGCDAYHFRKVEPDKREYFDIQIWDLMTGKVRTLKSGVKDGHLDFITALSISNDNKFFVTGSADGTIKIWSLDKQKVIESIDVLKIYKDSIESLAVSEGLNYIICGTMEGEIVIYQKEKDYEEPSEQEMLKQFQETKQKIFFNTATADDLKQICRDKNIKGFSKYRKADLTDFLINSLSREDIEELMEKKDVWIMSRINEAFSIITSKHRGERFISFFKIDEDNKEFEMMFERYKEFQTAFLSISNENINNPEFVCDCGLGANGGLCAHFWLGFIFALKKNFFQSTKWNLTALPKDFDTILKNIEIKTTGRDNKDIILYSTSSLSSKEGASDQTKETPLKNI